jgi:hypothetical protein
VSPEHFVAAQIAFVVQYRADVPTTEHAFEGVGDPEPGTKSAPDAFVRVIHAVSIGRPGGRLKRLITSPTTGAFEAGAPFERRTPGLDISPRQVRPRA